MARTAVPITALTPNAGLVEVAGTAIDPTNDHEIAATNLEELFLYIDATFAGAKTYTVKAGASPPALSAGQGDLVVSLNAQKAFIGPLTSARFAQADGKLYVDVEAAATGTIRAYRVPRTA